MMTPGLGSLLFNFEKFNEHKERLRTTSHDRGLDKNVAGIIIVAWIDYLVASIFLIFFDVRYII